MFTNNRYYEYHVKNSQQLLETVSSATKACATRDILNYACWDNLQTTTTITAKANTNI